MLSQREKKIIKGIDLMFQGMEDDELKEIVLASSLQKADEEKERIIELITKKKEEDAKYFNEKFEVDKSSFFYVESYDNELYIRQKNVKEKV
jgi:hypothetical protein